MKLYSQKVTACYLRVGPAACTDTQCKWLIPAHVSKMTYRPLSEMDFVSPRQKKKEIDARVVMSAESSAEVPVTTPTVKRKKVEPLPRRTSTVTSSTTTPSTSQQESSSVPFAAAASTPADSLLRPPSQSELAEFYARLAEHGRKPAVLSLVPPYSERYISEHVINALPLESIFSQAHAQLTMAELLTISLSVDVTLSESDVENIELATRGQSTNRMWFQYRAGRVTASRMKSVCRTNLDNPSVSLLKSICYPLANRFTSAATEWGLRKESVALNKYKESVSDHHNVSVGQCGLVIHTDFPYLAASPDALVSCDCCGKGVVEIKCPFKYRDASMDVYIQADDSCFETVDGEIELSKRHQYYYQVQTQLYVCDAVYCDFVVCTFDGDTPSIFVKRIFRDDALWSVCVANATNFFHSCILPELLGRAFTRQVQTD